MRARKLDEVPGLDIMMGKFSATFDRIDRACDDLDKLHTEFRTLVTKLELEFRSIRGLVKHQKGHLDNFFRDDER